MSRNRKSSAIEEHFNVDANFKLQQGMPKQDDNFNRDMHDWFNLIALVPLCVLNALNWTWGDLLKCISGQIGVVNLWHGAWFQMFFWATATYFVTDLLWMIVAPSCVKSPGVIVKHHVSTLLYILIPFFWPEYGWLMGACMSVEVNTWLIIARRVFNKAGENPWMIEVGKTKVQIKVISIAFYVTWILIRVIIYPVLWFVVVKEYQVRSAKVGYLNCLTVAPVLQLVFVCLNFKWTFDLALSKLKSNNKGPSKGL